jgi:hypothetical protein
VFETDGSVDLLAGSAGAIHSLIHIDPTGKQTTNVDVPFYYGYGITRALDGRYIVVGRQPLVGHTSMDVAYYNSDLTPDMSVGTQGIVNISILKSTILINPTGVGLRAVYTPDGSRTIVVGRIDGQKAAKNADGASQLDANGQPVYTDVEHFVVARIWN